MDMERIIALYMDDCHSRQLRPKTMQSYEQALKLFSTWLAETHAVTQVEAVKDIHIRSYINDLQTRGKYTSDVLFVDPLCGRLPSCRTSY